MNSDSSQKYKIAIALVFGAYFVWWSQQMLPHKGKVVSAWEQYQLDNNVCTK